MMFEAKAVFLKDLEKAKKRRAGGDDGGTIGGGTAPAQGAEEADAVPAESAALAENLET